MDFRQKIRLGRSGLKVGRLGISSSFGASSEVFEMAFEAGCNYFTYGTFVKGGSNEMCKAVRNLVKKGERDQLVVAIYSYSHIHFLVEYFLRKDLKRLGIDYADVLILGYYNQKPHPRMLKRVLQLKEKGLIRNMAVSSHKRKLFPELEKEKLMDVMHVRYNAVNRGAELDVFPFVGGNDRPGMVTYTATRWRQLLSLKRMPLDINPLKAVDAYRFVLSNSNVDVCMVGAKDKRQMQENLSVLDMAPMGEEEMKYIREIGDFIYGKNKIQPSSPK